MVDGSVAVLSANAIQIILHQHVARGGNLEDVRERLHFLPYFFKIYLLRPPITLSGSCHYLFISEGGALFTCVQQ